MSDPTPAPAPAPQTTTRAQWPISKEVIMELDLAEHVSTAAQRTVYAAALAEEDIDAAAIKSLTDAITAAEDLVFKATGGKAGNKILTKTQQDFKDTLVAKIRAVQKRAKRKYTSAKDPNRDKYFIGQDIEGNHGVLLQAGDAIGKSLAADQLPGAPATITDLTGALNYFKNSLARKAAARATRRRPLWR